MLPKRYQVFVSSTFRDLQSERQAVIGLIQEMNHIPAGMELFPSADEGAWQVIEQVIEQSDYFLLIVGGKYGSTTAEGISWTEKEYDFAYELKIPILPFMHGNPDEIPSGRSELEREARSRLELFRRKVEERHHRATWTSAEELKGKVAVGLVNAIALKPRVGWVRADGAEEVEELRRRFISLRDENDKLNQQLSSLSELVAEHEQVDIFSQGEDEINLTFKVDADGQSREVHQSTTWHNIFSTMASITAPGASERTIQNKISQAIGPKNGWLVDESLETVRVQLLALKLIDLEKMPEQRSRNQLGQRIGMSGGETYTTYVTGWRLTDNGKRLYAELKAIRREK